MAGSAQHEGRSLRLWFGMLAAPVVWAIHFGITYGLVAIACTARFATAEFVGLRAVELIMVGTAAVSILGIVAAGRSARRAAGDAPRAQDEEGGRIGYMVRLGTLLSFVFVALILIETLPVFLLDPCRRAP